MPTAKSFFKVMRESPRAGQVIQLKARDGKHLVIGFRRHGLTELTKPKDSPTQALADALRWIYGHDKPKHTAIKDLGCTPTVEALLDAVQEMGWVIKPTSLTPGTYDVTRTAEHIAAIGGGFASPEAYFG